MPLDPVTEARPPRRRGGPPWAPFAVALGIGLVVGGIVGFAVRGGGGGTATVTVAPTTTRAAVDPATARAARERRLRTTARLVVLNGTSITGLAARSAERARLAGWRRVEAGNGPAVSGTSQVFVLEGQQAAGSLAARDLDALPPRPLPPDSPLPQQFPRGQVFVLLGPQADLPPETAPADTTATGP